MPCRTQPLHCQEAPFTYIFINRIVFWNLKMFFSRVFFLIKLINASQIFVRRSQQTNNASFITPMVPMMLKMLGLYLHIPKIGHKRCNMLSILNGITLQKELHNFVTIYCVLHKKVNPPQQQNTKECIKILARARNRNRVILHPRRMRYLWTTESTESFDCCQSI